MKKKIALIMALALSVTTVFAGCGAKDDQKQRESGSGTQKTFTVGFDQDFPPMGFVGDDGEYTGFDFGSGKGSCRQARYEICSEADFLGCKRYGIELRRN